MSNRISGLTDHQASVVRAACRQALDLSAAHSGQMAYSEGPTRWDWHKNNELAKNGKFPRDTDCSGYATWVLFNGLRIYGVHDIVNGENWTGGYTGTMLDHGKPVHHRENIKLGDLAIYNGHVAVCIGGGYVLSHGSPGIHKLLIDYRGDLVAIRRYI